MRKKERLLSENYKAVRYDIFKLCAALNYTPTAQQRRLLEAVQRGSPRIACKSGQGPGKTKVSGVIGLWWALQSYGAKVIVSAPTMRQCKDIWIAELGRTLRYADDWLQRLVEVQATKVVIAGNRDWGVQTMTAKNQEDAAGFHEKNLKVILEEASGVDRSVTEQFLGTLSNPRAAMLQIGNPTNRTSYFFDCFNGKRGQWTTFTFNAEETEKSLWFDPIRNKQLEEEFGRDSDVYRVRVLGEFPHSDPKCVMSSEDLEKLTDKSRIARASSLSAVKQFGYDFARWGGDENTAYQRLGEAIIRWGFWPRTDPHDAVDQVWRWQHDAGWRDQDCLHVPDAGGLGQGVMRRFHDAGKRVLEFHNGGSAGNSRKYANKITEAYFEFARKVKAHIPALPHDNILIQQLCSRQYATNKAGQLVIESKDQYEKRGFDSPDRAEGCVLAFYDPVVSPQGSVMLPQRAQRVAGGGLHVRT